MSAYGSGGTRMAPTFQSMRGMTGMPSNASTMTADAASKVMQGMFGDPSNAGALQMDQHGRVRDISDVSRAWKGVLRVPTNYVIRQLQAADQWQYTLMPMQETNATHIEYGGVMMSTVMLDELAYRTQPRAFGLQSKYGRATLKYYGRQIHTALEDLETEEGMIEWRLKIDVMMNAIVATHCYMIGSAIVTAQPFAAERAAAYYQKSVTRSAMTDLLAMEVMLTGVMNKSEYGVAQAMGFLRQSMAGRGGGVSGDTFIISASMARFYTEIVAQAAGMDVHISKPVMLDASMRDAHDPFSASHTVGLIAINSPMPYVDAPTGRSHRALRTVELQDLAETDDFRPITLRQQVHGTGLITDVRDMNDWTFSPLGAQTFGTTTLGDQLRTSGLRDTFIASVLRLKGSDYIEAMRRFAHLAGAAYAPVAPAGAARPAPAVRRRSRSAPGSPPRGGSPAPTLFETSRGPAAAGSASNAIDVRTLTDGGKTGFAIQVLWQLAGLLTHDELMDLRTRIDALSDEEEEKGGDALAELRGQLDRHAKTEHAKDVFERIMTDGDRTSEQAKWWDNVTAAINDGYDDRLRELVGITPGSGTTSGHYVTTFHGEKVRMSEGTQGRYAEAPRAGSAEYTEEYAGLMETIVDALNSRVDGWAARHPEVVVVVAAEVNGKGTAAARMNTINVFVDFVAELVGAIYQTRETHVAYDTASHERSMTLQSIDRLLLQDPIAVLEELFQNGTGDALRDIATLARTKERDHKTKVDAILRDRSVAAPAVPPARKRKRDDEDDGGSAIMREWFESIPMSGSVLFIIDKFDLFFPWGIALIRPDIVLRTGAIAFVDSRNLGKLYMRGQPLVKGGMNSVTGEIHATLTTAAAAVVTAPENVSVLHGAVVDNILSGAGVGIVLCDATSVNIVHAARASGNRSAAHQPRSIYTQLVPAGYTMKTMAVDISAGHTAAHDAVSPGSHVDQLPWTGPWSDHWQRGTSTVGRRPGVGDDDIVPENRSPNTVCFADKMRRMDFDGRMILASKGGGHFGEYRDGVGQAFRGLRRFPTVNPAALTNMPGSGHNDGAGYLATVGARG